MPLSPGTTLGPYNVTAKLGEGGMGEVYRARDTKLDRDVALKVLPQAFTDDPDRLARFEREAKVLASLNHPNIGHIYGLEEAEGQKALVLELVEGPTLADRIAQGPIPVDEALPIAKQIAEALEAAHEAGVIHRDLKPANIKVRDDGMVKVLDFGLAKAFEPEAGSVSASMSPTISLTAAATQMGMVIGTAAYMAPEQAKGLPVDKRADIWAYGAVLFEMLTGRKLFDAGDVSEMLASVLVKDPDVSSIGPHVPAHVRSVIRRCLVKDPKKRLRDIGDVRLAMEGAFDAGVSTPSTEARVVSTGRFRRSLPIGATALLSILATAFVVWTATRPTPPRIARFQMATALPPTLDTGQTPGITLSPDGTRFAYMGEDRQLYVRELVELEATPLPGAPRGLNPFFSPDGGSVGYFSGGELRRQSLQGGPAVTISETTGIDGASWGADGAIIFATRYNNLGLLSVPAAGGEVVQVTTLEEGETAHRWPEILPDGSSVLFTVVRDNRDDIELAAIDLDTGERHSLIQRAGNAHYSRTGHIVYAVDGSLLAVAFDLNGLRVLGDPVPMLDGVVTQPSGAAMFSLSNDGSLAYIPGSSGRGAERGVVSLDQEGRQEPLATLPQGDYRSLDVSPDGERLALQVGDGTPGSNESADIWIHDVARGTLDRLTTHAAEDGNPLWSPDGRHVVFTSRRDDTLGLYRRAADGTGGAELLHSDGTAERLIATEWTPGGEGLVVTERRSNQDDLVLYTLEEDSLVQSRPLLDSSFRERRAAISPDGNWIAYESNASGRDEVYIERFPEMGGRELVSRNGGMQPHWSPDGRQLFFLVPPEELPLESDRLVAAQITGESPITVGTPALFAEGRFYTLGQGRTYDVAADGRLAAVQYNPPDPLSQQIVLVQNWVRELTELIPAN